MAAVQSEERAARNEVLFREANEKLGEKRQELDIEGRTPFICECGDPTWFLVAHDHETQSARLVEEHEDYVIVEKVGEAGRIAAEEDPRS